MHPFKTQNECTIAIQSSNNTQTQHREQYKDSIHKCHTQMQSGIGTTMDSATMRIQYTTSTHKFNTWIQYTNSINRFNTQIEYTNSHTDSRLSVPSQSTNWMHKFNEQIQYIDTKIQ